MARVAELGDFRRQLSEGLLPGSGLFLALALGSAFFAGLMCVGGYFVLWLWVVLP